MRAWAQPGRVATLEFEKKILLLGDAAVGKTSLIRRFVVDRFADSYIATIGTKTTRKTMYLNYAKSDLTVQLNLSIWDIIGQKGMERTHKVYFPGTEAAIFVADLTRPDTFDSLGEWAAALKGVCGDVSGVVAANKVDLTGMAAVSDAQAEAAARGVGYGWLKTSAKTGENVEQAFRSVATDLCRPLVAKYRRG